MSPSGFCVDMMFTPGEPFAAALRMSDLQSLAGAVENELVGEPVPCFVRVLGASLAEHFEIVATSGACRAAVLVSRHFLEADGPALRATALAERLAEIAERAHVPVALVAVTDAPAEKLCQSPPGGIHWIARAGDGLAATLREGVRQVLPRLWYQAPPPHPHVSSNSGEGIVIDYPRSRDELLEMFRLRFQVYKLLEYLPTDVASSTMQIEMDAYDPDAMHLIARDTRTGAVAGCARLILPSRAMDEVLENALCLRPPLATRDWVRELAQREKSNVFQERLQGTQRPLPAAAMEAYRQLRESLGIRSAHDWCEMSRLIVAPAYRGLDLSARISDAAHQIASWLGRQVMLIECAPHHRRFYHSRGFEAVAHLGDHAEPARGLRTRALTMWTRLKSREDASGPKANLRMSLNARQLTGAEAELVVCRLQEELPVESRLCLAPGPESKGPASGLPIHIANGGHVTAVALALAARLGALGGGSLILTNDRGEPVEITSADPEEIAQFIQQLIQ